jgi:2-dehydro-3-deoxyphosphogluconate aldolase / (4S)-4-hydroxy-2-oxoglutarate aldolase
MRPPLTTEALMAATVIPVVRTTRTDLAEQAIEWLQQVGFATFEITLTVPDALSLIRQLRHQPGVRVGAGTVLSVAQAEACLEAGAEFLVSPIAVDGLPPIAAAVSAPLLLGGLTPSEVHRAFALGASAVKVFPAGSVGGPGYIRALRSLFPDIPLVPTGGVDLDNLHAYLDAGAASVGIGSDLISDRRIREADPGAWMERARHYLEAAHRARPLRTQGST